MEEDFIDPRDIEDDSIKAIYSLWDVFFYFHEIKKNNFTTKQFWYIF